jgi:uncharacterized membrane protein
MEMNTQANAMPAKHSSAYGDNFKHLFEGVHFRFPKFQHTHPAIINVNEVADDQLTMGQRVADRVATGMGSWRFIIIQSVIVVVWIISNVWLLTHPFDPYPLILLNLLFSTQAAYAAPVIMMSQNRQAAKDRLMAESDYHCNIKGEEEIRHIMDHLDHQDDLILQIVKRLEEQHMEMREQLARLDPAMAQQVGRDIVKASEEMVDGGDDVAGNS